MKKVENRCSKAGPSKNVLLLPRSKAALTITPFLLLQSYFKYLHMFRALLSEEAARTVKQALLSRAWDSESPHNNAQMHSSSVTQGNG